MAVAVKATLKRFAINRANISNARARGERKAFFRQGGYLRRVIRNKVRKRSENNPAPAPPGIWSTGNQKTLKYVRFMYEANRNSMVVGPVRVSNVEGPGGQAITTVPELMEYGGTAKAVYYQNPGDSRLIRRRRGVRRPEGRRVVKTLRYKPRKWVRSSWTENKDTLLGFWKDSIG